MLTLREVKQLIEIPEKGAGTPTARYMKDCGTVLLCRRMGDGAKLTVYREGYAAYEAGKHAVIRRMCRDKLRDALAELSGPDIFLIRLLYFEEVSISEAARLCGCSRKTIRNRREKILAELNRRMSKSGVTDGNF